MELGKRGPVRVREINVEKVDTGHTELHTFNEKAWLIGLFKGGNFI